MNYCEHAITVLYLWPINKVLPVIFIFCLYLSFPTAISCFMTIVKYLYYGGNLVSCQNLCSNSLYIIYVNIYLWPINWVLPVGADIWVGEHLCFFRTFTGTQGQTAQAKVLRFWGTGAPGGGSLPLGCCAVITSLYIKCNVQSTYIYG